MQEPAIVVPGSPCIERAIVLLSLHIAQTNICRTVIGKQETGIPPTFR